MIDAFWFWLVLELVGLGALPAARLLLGRLPGGGFGFARPLGLLLAAYPAWLLASTHIAPYGRGTAVGGIALVAVCGAAVALRMPHHNAARLRSGLRTIPVRLWLVGELLFTSAFFGWALMRSYSPDVWGVEKPPEVTIVSAINRSDWFPPHDAWFSGGSVNYYYFGHYLDAFLVRVTGVDRTVGFNLGLAAVFALTLTAVFALASALYLAARRAGAPRRSPILVGMVAVFLTALLGNVAGGIEYLRHPTRFLAFDWWAPTHVITGTTNDIPVFSFLLGDFHPHVVAVPFALLGIAIALQLALTGPRLRPRPKAAVEILLAALVVGCLYPTNSWNFPVAVALVAAGLVLYATRHDAESGARRRALVWGALWLVATVVLFLPFWLRFHPAERAVGIVGNRSSLTRFLHDEGLIYGLFLWVIAAAFVHRLAAVPRRYLAVGLAGLAAAVAGLAPSHRGGLALVLALLAFAVYTAFDPRHPQPYRFVWLLLAAGLGAIAVGELVFLEDPLYGVSSPQARFNTVFKFGYQAWYLLALPAACLIFWSRAWMSRWTRRFWSAGLAVLVALGVAYSVAGSYARSGGFSSSPTLHGYRWLTSSSPGDLEAIAWLGAHAAPGARVLEAAGGDFTAAGRISAYTGLPTVIEWPGHEVQWGHDPGKRVEDVATIYSTTDVRRARALLARYDIDYVVVGSIERADYPSAGLAKFSRLGRHVYAAGGTVVYETRRRRQTA